MTARGEGGRDATDQAVLALVRTSLAVWSADARVRRTDDGLIEIETQRGAMHIARAPLAVPFRWLVRIEGRERAASSVAGLLRLLRSAVDDAWRPGRARIAPLLTPGDVA
ncbi:MAG: hypothetical protein R3D67_12985 [Hyphomicrobiaceae bacterium]